MERGRWWTSWQLVSSWQLAARSWQERGAAHSRHPPAPVRRDGALPAGETPAVQNIPQVDRCRLGGWDGGVSPPSCSRPRIIAATATTAGNDRFISAKS